MATATKSKTKKVNKTKKKTAPKKENTQKHVENNPYRAGSNYAVCFDCLFRLSKEKPVTRKALLDEYAKITGKDRKRAKYDIAVVLSPSKEGTGHRSSRKEAYWVEKLENSRVRLHMAK